MIELQASQHNSWKVGRYRDSRYWGVWDESGELVCICVYRKGAREVVRRLAVKEAGATASNNGQMETTKDGFVTADDTGLMGEVASILERDAPELNTRVEHTGGGIFCVVVELREHGNVLYWGASETKWGADVCDNDGGFVGYVTAPVPSAERDAAKVARAISETVAAFEPVEG